MGRVKIEARKYKRGHLRRIAIKLVPSAFIVRADNQNNNPAVILVNPGSITKVRGTKDHNTIGQAQVLRERGN